jgi:hypothetical protein
MDSGVLTTHVILLKHASPKIFVAVSFSDELEFGLPGGNL